MQRLLGILLLVACASAGDADVTPVQKVIKLLTDMKEKGAAEVKAESAQFDTYQRFCDENIAEKSRAVSEATERIEVLKADIAKAAADEIQLAKEIKEHGENLNTASKEETSAVEIRATEKKEYDALYKDYSESVNALTRAIKVLQQQKEGKRPESLLQLNANSSPEDAMRSVNAFLMEGASSESDLSGTFGGKVYDFSPSGGIIELLQGLQNKFVDERIAVEKAEAGKRQAHSLLVQSLKAQQEANKKELSEKTQFKAQRSEQKAQADGSLKETTGNRAADQKYLDDLKATCAQKSKEFVERTKLRKEELEAIQKAVDIIASSAVQGTAQKKLPTLLQGGASAFALLRAKHLVPFTEVVKLLQDKARSLHSDALKALADRVEDEQPVDVMAKVRQMIQTMVKDLKEQAQADATQKAFCDGELKTNEKTRLEKTEAATLLKSNIDELQATIATLGDEIIATNDEVTILDGALANATKIRDAEKAQNKQTIAEAKEAKLAVRKAMDVLGDFYKKASKATVMLQSLESPKSPPPIFNKPYTGMGDASTGVLGMLEVIASDFDRLEKETTGAEEAAAQEYETFMKDSRMDKAQKTKDVMFKTTRKVEKGQELEAVKADLRGTQEELNTALAYYEKLKPQCADATVSYEKAKADREKSLAELKQALEVLSSISA